MIETIVPMIETILLRGAILGATYALLALGFTLIFGVSGVVNMAHGAFFMLGAYIFSFSVYRLIDAGLGASYATALGMVVAPLLVGIIASLFYRLTLHQILGDDIAILVVSMIGSLIFQQIIYLTFGPQFIAIPAYTSGSVIVFGISVTTSMILSAVISMVLFVGLSFFIATFKAGKAMKALSEDREAAMLMGVSAEKIYMLTAAVSAALASVAGILITSSTTGVGSASMWLSPLAVSFAIVVLGGLGSIRGTLIGGFIFGYAETAIALTLPESGYIVPAVPFAILLISLIIRPKGLFGKRIEMEE